MMRSGLTIRATTVIVAVSFSFATGCGAARAACGSPVREPLDPNHLLHVTDPAVARYQTDPPTSGAHLGTPGPEGFVATPLLPAVQVTILERGDVLVQYRDPTDAAALASLVRNRVVVAPQPSLPARVVVTAWTYKLSCSAVDAKALTKFAEAHAGKPLEH